MDPVIVLVAIAAVLLFYQLFLAKDRDALDAYAVLLFYQLFLAKDRDALDAYGHDVNVKEKSDHTA
jgi:hypothetical protein